MKLHSYAWDKIPSTIEAVASESGKLQTKIHAVCISILVGWANDAERGAKAAEYFTALQNSVPWHGKSVANWIGLVSGMKWSEETERWYVQAGQKFGKDKLDYAKKNPFWEVSPPPKAKPLTDELVLKLLESILEKQKKHEKKPVEGDAFSKAGNEHIRAAIESLKARA